jgi:hypothetical protein
MTAAEPLGSRRSHFTSWLHGVFSVPLLAAMLGTVEINARCPSFWIRGHRDNLRWVAPLPRGCSSAP